VAKRWFISLVSKGQFDMGPHTLQVTILTGLLEGSHFNNPANVVGQILIEYGWYRDSLTPRFLLVLNAAKVCSVRGILIVFSVGRFIALHSLGLTCCGGRDLAGYGSEQGQTRKTSCDVGEVTEYLPCFCVTETR